MATYRVSYRQTTDEWTVKKSGRVVRTFQTKDPAKRAAARFADSSKDKVIFERQDGSVQQDRVFDNPR
jgi:hypothetical protein